MAGVKTAKSKMTSYDFLAKEIHRSTILVCHKQTPDLPILYLDGENGEATESFLKHGIPKKMLIPVNFNATVIRGIKVAHGVSGCS